MQTGSPHACRHLRGYWIDKNTGRFRCYDCGFQVWRADLAPNFARKIEDWQPGASDGDRETRNAAGLVARLPHNED